MGIDVSKLTTQEATDKLNELIQSKCEDDITLKYDDYLIFTLDVNLKLENGESFKKTKKKYQSPCYC